MPAGSVLCRLTVRSTAACVGENRDIGEEKKSNMWFLKPGPLPGPEAGSDSPLIRSFTFTGLEQDNCSAGVLKDTQERKTNRMWWE